MAVKEITPVKGELNKITPITMEAANDTTTGMVFTLPRTTDEYVVVLVHNTASAAQDFTIKKPTNGSYFASASDETHNLAAGEIAIFRFESAKWANNDGTINCVPANVAVKAAVVY